MMKRWIYLFCTIFPILILFVQAEWRTIFLFFVFGVIAIVLIGLINGNRRNKIYYVKKQNIFYDCMIVLYLADVFYFRWRVSSKVAFIAGKIGLSSTYFLIIVILILGALAMHGVDYVIETIRDPIITVISRKLGRFVAPIGKVIRVIIIVLLQYVQLQHSTFAGDMVGYYGTKPYYFIISLCILFAFNIVLTIITTKWTISLLISSILVTIWSIANFYVIQFHVDPLYISELVNFKTAMDVAGTYNYKITLSVLFVIAVLLSEIRLLYKLEIPMIYSSVKLVAVNLACVLIIGLFLICNKTLLVSPENMGCMRRNAVLERGFPLAMIQDALVNGNSIILPDAYNEVNLTYTRFTSEENDDYPDIILILNETFCNLDVYTDIQTDIDYLADYYSIEDAVYGYAIVPNAGSGTNNSEFELLTSKSMYLLPVSAPFQYLSAENESRSTVNYLKSLGYVATGMHCQIATNYARDEAYPALGFDYIYLGNDNFTYGTYGNRPWLDIDNYSDMESWYEEHMDEGPQFMYLLTFQNHGGHEQNESKYDQVHCIGDYGSWNDEINEYLTSVQASSTAFKELIEYYKKVDRKVIVLMVGDHAPPFINNLPIGTDVDDSTIEIAERTVPYVIWANYELKHIRDLYTEYATMTDLIPMVMYAAGLRLNPFYQTLLNVHQAYPVRTRTGVTRDVQGLIEKYDSQELQFSILNEYYNLEYNSLLETEEYRDEFFK